MIFMKTPELSRKATIPDMTNGSHVLCFRQRLRGMGEYAALGLLFGGVMAALSGWTWFWPVLVCGTIFGIAGFRQGPTPPVNSKTTTW